MTEKTTEVSKRTFPWVGVTLGGLTLLFSWAKIMGHLTWPWWLTLLPIYVVPAALLGLSIVALLVAGVIGGSLLLVSFIMDVVESRKSKRNKLRPTVTIKSRD